jgi:anti-anti-sigma factor
MSEPSCLRLEQDGDVTVVGFKDASILDVVVIQRIGRELYKLVDEDQRRKVVLDFGDVRFLSSQALGVLLTLRRKADRFKTKIALAAIRPELVKVFRLTNLDQLFDFCADRETAVAKLNEA